MPVVKRRDDGRPQYSFGFVRFPADNHFRAHLRRNGQKEEGVLSDQDLRPEYCIWVRDHEMKCSKDEALLILGKWRHDRSKLLLAFQPYAGTEVVRVRGRIARLDVDEFLFVSIACSVSVAFAAATIEYEESATNKTPHGQRQRCATCCLRLQLPTTNAEQARNAVTALASTFISITEAAR